MYGNAVGRVSQFVSQSLSGVRMRKWCTAIGVSTAVMLLLGGIQTAQAEHERSRCGGYNGYGGYQRGYSNYGAGFGYRYSEDPYHYYSSPFRHHSGPHSAPHVGPHFHWNHGYHVGPHWQRHDDDHSGAGHLSYGPWGWH